MKAIVYDPADPMRAPANGAPDLPPRYAALARRALDALSPLDLCPEEAALAAEWLADLNTEAEQRQRTAN